MKVNALQKSILNIDSPITILANGRCVGTTTGLLLKAVTSKCWEVQFYLPHRGILQHTMKNFLSLLESLGKTYKVNHAQAYVLLDEGKCVSFLTPEEDYECKSNLWYKKRTGDTLVIIDQVEMFKQYFIDYQIEMQDRNGNHLMFSTQPYYCGWRNFKFEAGYIVLDETGIPEVEIASWDYQLVNWSEVGTESRCKPEHYKSHVAVLTGFGVDTEVSTFMEELPSDELFRLSGTWKKGMKLTSGGEK